MEFIEFAIKSMVILKGGYVSVTFFVAAFSLYSSNGQYYADNQRISAQCKRHQRMAFSDGAQGMSRRGGASGCVRYGIAINAKTKQVVLSESMSDSALNRVLPTAIV